MNSNKYPEPTVGAIIFNPEGEILLARSHKWKDNYVIPGGHIELGEKIEDALRREIMEETGLKIYDIHLVGLQQCIYEKDFHEKKHFIFIDFACKVDTTKVKLNEEHQEYIWVNIDSIEQLPLEPFTRKLLKEYEASMDSKYSQKILYDYY